MSTRPLVLLSFVLAACEPGIDTGKVPPDTAVDTSGGGNGGGAVIDTAPPEDTVDSGDKDSVEPPVESVDAAFTGTITLQLYTTDDEGDVVYENWADVYGAYPFGKVFVAAYDDDGAGNYTYYGQIAATPDENGIVSGYEVPVHGEGLGSFHVYAADDWWPDNLIATYEPIGTYPDTVSVTDGALVEGVDITVLVPYYDISGGGGGGGGGEGCDTVTLGGDVDVLDTSYAGGDVAALVYDTNYEGPLYESYATPSTTTDGASAPYAFSFCQGAGAGVLLGAWDQNLNGLFDPDDAWGTFVDNGADGNPIDIETEDLLAHDVLVPFEGATVPSIVPTVIIRGTVTVDGELATDPPADAITYVVLSKTRPPTDFDVTDDSAWYDRSSFDATTMKAGSFDYTVAMPGNTVGYLWAFIDLDGDGIVNEADEPVGAAFSLSGQFNSGRANLDGVNFHLADPSSPELR